MNRLQVAVGILAALFLLTLLGGSLVSGSLNLMENRLTEVETLCTREEYGAAQQQIDKLTLVYQKKQALLALFIRRDRLSELESALRGLPAYAQPEYKQDLLCETGKLKAQIESIRRLFFGLL